MITKHKVTHRLHTLYLSWVYYGVRMHANERHNNVGE